MALWKGFSVIGRTFFLCQTVATKMCTSSLLKPHIFEALLKKITFWCCKIKTSFLDEMIASQEIDTMHGLYYAIIIIFDLAAVSLFTLNA